MPTQKDADMKKNLKKVVKQLKTAQERFQVLLKDKSWLEDARKYAEVQGKEIKKLISADIGKVKAFLDKEKRELDKFQRQIPGEIKKFKTYMGSQKKELEKILNNVKKATGQKTAGKKTATRKTRSKKTVMRDVSQTASPTPTPTSSDASTGYGTTDQN
jgi:hypothetical protein